jgi:hypothetical protein
LQMSPGIVQMEGAAMHLTTAKSRLLFQYLHCQLCLRPGPADPIRVRPLTRPPPTRTMPCWRRSMSSSESWPRRYSPTVARLSDIFGCIEIFPLAVVLFTLGTMVETFAKNVQTFAGGAIPFQLGYKVTIENHDCRFHVRQDTAVLCLCGQLALPHEQMSRPPCSRPARGNGVSVCSPPYIPCAPCL